MQTLYPVGVSVAALEAEAGGDRSGLSADLLTQALQDDAQAAYDRRVEELGEPVIRELERQVILNVPRPQMARASVRDGLPAGGHRTARDGPARPTGRVPEGGLRPVRRHDERHQEETVGYMFHVQPTVEGEDEQDDEIEELGATEAPQLVAPGLVHERPQQVQYPRPRWTRRFPHTSSGDAGRWQRP